MRSIFWKRRGRRQNAPMADEIGVFPVGILERGISYDHQEDFDNPERGENPEKTADNAPQPTSVVAVHAHSSNSVEAGTSFSTIDHDNPGLYAIPAGSL